MSEQHPEQGIGPQPTPQQISVGEATDQAGRKFVVMQFISVNGTWVCFLPPEQAKQIANQILSASSNGLVVASADQLPPTPLGAFT